MTVRVVSGAEDQKVLKERQKSKQAIAGKPMPHDWMHHFQRPRFLKTTDTGGSSATAQDAPNPSGHQTLAELFWGGSLPTQADLPNDQVPL